LRLDKYDSATSLVDIIDNGGEMKVRHVNPEAQSVSTV